MSRPPAWLTLQRALCSLVVSVLIVVIPSFAPGSPAGANTPPKLANVSQSIPSAHPAPDSSTGPSSATAVRHHVMIDNPLANLKWRPYTGKADKIYPLYESTRAATKRTLLGRVALTPTVHWFGGWNTNAEVYKTVRQYIDNVTGGRNDVLVQMALFRLSPWEGKACNHVYTSGEAASYRTWINRVARAIGSTHVALILQPDMPFMHCIKHSRHVALSMVHYGAWRLSRLRNTSVYIDMGAADWNMDYAQHRHSASKAAYYLEEAGVRFARGFALNATHYDSTERQIYYGSSLVKALARRGFPDRHFVISTAQNGRPFTATRYWARHPHGDFNNAPACTSSDQRTCATLGIPPTWRVANPAWHLPPVARGLAGKHVDAYLWIGRPWLRGVPKVFNFQRTLNIARTTPYAQYLP
jgi:endoglucanase